MFRVFHILCQWSSCFLLSLFTSLPSPRSAASTAVASGFRGLNQFVALNCKEKRCRPCLLDEHGILLLRNLAKKNFMAQIQAAIEKRLLRRMQFHMQPNPGLLILFANPYELRFELASIEDAADETCAWPNFFLLLDKTKRSADSRTRLRKFRNQGPRPTTC